MICVFFLLCGFRRRDERRSGLSVFDRGIYGFPSSDVDVAHGAALSCLSVFPCWARDEVYDYRLLGGYLQG